MPPVLALPSLLAALSCGGGSGGSNPPVPAPDFTLSIGTPTPVQAGFSASVPVTITRLHGESASVSVTVAANPEGVTGAGVIAPGTSSAAIPVAVPASDAGGVYTLEIDATDGAAQHSGTLALTVTAVPDFSFSVSAPAAIPPGQSGSATVSVTRTGGYVAALTLSVPANPEGVTGSGTIAAGSSSGALALAVPAAAAPGTYTLAAAATDGTLVCSATFSVTLSSTSPGTLTIPVLYISQSTQTRAFDVPLVKDRDGYLRAFVVANGPNTAQPSLLCEIRNGSTTVFSRTIPAPASSVPTAVDESSLLNSWNVAVPAAAIQPGYTVLATLSAGGVTWPASGTPQPLDVRTLPPFVSTIWAVQTGDGRLGGGGTLASDAAKYPGDLQRIWPVNNATDVTYGGVFTTSVETLQADGTNWDIVLSDLHAKQAADPGGSSGQYFGVVNTSYGSGVAGIGYIGLPTAIGWDRSGFTDVYAHETGHNFGRLHAPCGVSGSTDPDWPTAPAYANALIGAWGLDTATGTLYDPGVNHDLMSYCSPVWVSDYNYEQVLARRQGGTSLVVVAPAAHTAPAAKRSLLLWGRMEDGAAILEPAFHLPVDARPPGPGTQLMEGLDGSGRVLFATSFELTEVADLPQGRRAGHFAFSVPLSVADAGRLSEIRWTRNGERMASTVLKAKAGVEPLLQAGPDGRTTLVWDADAEPMVMVRDRATGNVLGFGRGGSHTFTAGPGDLEIHLANGVSSRSVTLGRSPSGLWRRVD